LGQSALERWLTNPLPASPPPKADSGGIGVKGGDRRLPPVAPASGERGSGESKQGERRAPGEEPLERVKGMTEEARLALLESAADALASGYAALRKGDRGWAAEKIENLWDMLFDALGMFCEMEDLEALALILAHPLLDEKGWVEALRGVERTLDRVLGPIANSLSMEAKEELAERLTALLERYQLGWTGPMEEEGGWE